MTKNNCSFDGFDIIGDVHGCATALRALLDKLGYIETDHGYCYHDAAKPRQVLFLGDLIDRGSEIKDSLNIAKTMWDNGNAQVIMGNHELNAIAWHTPFQQGFVRQHSERAYMQLKATLQQFDDDKPLFDEYLRWFRQLPLFLEFEHFRLVHACWDQQLIDNYQALYGKNQLTDDVLLDAANGNTFAKCFLERLTQGVNISLPNQRYMLNKQGFKRHRFRAKFWSKTAQTYQDAVFQPDPLPADIAVMPLSDQDKKAIFLYDTGEKPLFIGHYWLRGTPHRVSANIVCLDYSAVNQGLLVAYRMQNKAMPLSDDAFVMVENKTV